MGGNEGVWFIWAGSGCVRRVAWRRRGLVMGVRGSEAGAILARSRSLAAEAKGYGSVFALKLGILRLILSVKSKGYSGTSH